MPKNLTGRQKELLREFEASTTDDNQQQKKSFWDKMKEAFKGE